MPPKAAPKEKVAKGDEAEEMVAQYLRGVNRPYASTDVSANLKNKVPKAAAQKVMMTLADKGILTKKDYGKQSIFVYNQAHLAVLSAEEMADTDKEVKKVQGDLEEKRKHLKILQGELNEKEQLPKTNDLNREIEKVRAENDLTLKALLPYRNEGGTTAIQPLDSNEIKRIDDTWTRCRKEWISRRKVYKDLIGMLTDCGQIASLLEFEDNQGINPDDEESKEVETGEFCKQAPRPAPVKKMQVVTSTKRPANAGTPTASSQEDAGKKKKVKKA